MRRPIYMVLEFGVVVTVLVSCAHSPVRPKAIPWVSAPLVTSPQVVSPTASTANVIVGVEVLPQLIYVTPPAILDPMSIELVIGSSAYVASYYVLFGHSFYSRWHFRDNRWRGLGYGHPGYVSLPFEHFANPDRHDYVRPEPFRLPARSLDRR